MVSARHLCGSLLGGSALSRGLPTGRFIHLPHLHPLRLDSSPDKEFSLPSPGMVGSSQVTNEQTEAPREVRTGTNSPGGVVSPSTWEETEAPRWEAASAASDPKQASRRTPGQEWGRRLQKPLDLLGMHRASCSRTPTHQNLHLVTG